MKLKFLFPFLFLLYPSFLYSHTNHYSKIKSIEMDILRNGEKIGYSKYNMIAKNNFFIVKNDKIKFYNPIKWMKLLMYIYLYLRLFWRGSSDG